MYTILKDNQKEPILTTNSDSKFIDFVKTLTSKSDNFSILGVADAMEYIEDFCPELTLIEN